MTLGVETIELLPLKNWGQLDIYKWRVRGKLPGTPAGLEITVDHLKLLGETVSVKDPDACTKLERLFSDWLAVEKETLELAKKKAQTKPAPISSPESTSAPEAQRLHFHAEPDNKGIVRVQCLRGKELMASIGLNTAGFQSLISQGFMRKPHSLKTGALHDWIEIDGILFSFEKGNNDAEKLTRALNESYLPAAGLGGGKEVVVYANAASSTGFDIQFPAKAGGQLENRRRPLTEEALDLLQDPDHCGLLQKGLVLKLTRPTLIFKQKTPDGGERYLNQCPENVVKVVNDDGEEKLIDLSHPVNYLHLSAVELTAVFNHPSVNRHSQAAPAAVANGAPTRSKPQAVAPGASPVSSAPAPTPSPPAATELVPTLIRPSTTVANAPPVAVAAAVSPPPSRAPAVAAADIPPRPDPTIADAPKRDLSDGAVEKPLATMGGVPGRTRGQEASFPALTGVGTAATAVPEVKLPGLGPSEPRTPALPPGSALPNLWLKPVLEQQPLRFDWLTCLIYGKIAAWFHNSSESTWFGQKCWCVDLGESPGTENPGANPALKAILLTEAGSFAFVNGPCLARFDNASAAIGSCEAPLEVAEVRLRSVGLDDAGRFVFIVSDGFRAKFGVPEARLNTELASLKEQGAVLLSVNEALRTEQPLQVIWTAPVEQPNADDLQALESRSPEHGEQPVG